MNYTRFAVYGRQCVLRAVKTGIATLIITDNGCLKDRDSRTRAYTCASHSVLPGVLRVETVGDQVGNSSESYLPKYMLKKYRLKGK